MENELLFMIGEAILLEVEGVKDVRYPKEENPNKFDIEFEDENCYEVTLKNTSKTQMIVRRVFIL